MQYDLNTIKSPPMNTICFSTDRKRMYGFSKYYNEFFEVNLQNHKMRSLGKLEGERDYMNLAFQMEYYDGKIIIIPRMASCLSIYDCHTGIQQEFKIEDILTGIKYNHAGLFFCIYERYLYLIHRNPVIISRFDLNTFEHREVYSGASREKYFLSLFNRVGNYAACFAIEKNELLLFNAEKERARYIALPKECAGFISPFFDGEFVWLYHLERNLIYKCSLSGELLHEWKLEHNMDPEGLHMVFRLINGGLFLFPNKQECYYRLEDNRVIMHKCKMTENDICWLAGDDGNNPFYLCLEWDGRGGCPHQDMHSIIDLKYRMLNLEDDVFEDVLVYTDLQEGMEYVRDKIMQSFLAFFGKNTTEDETAEVPFQTFLNVIAYKGAGQKTNVTHSFDTGRSIFKTVK